MFDENLYQETISALHASEDTLSEVMNMTHKTKRRGRLRTTAVLAAVIAILCCMAAAAAALPWVSEYVTPDFALEMVTVTVAGCETLPVLSAAV